MTGPVVHEEQGLGFYFLYIGQHLGDFEQANVVVLFNFFFLSPLMGMKFQFCKEKGVMEIDGGGGCPALEMCLKPQNCTLKNS